MFTTLFLFVDMTCSRYKGPLVYITGIIVLEIVQYTFCKSLLELVVVVSICILLIFILCFAFCGPALWALYSSLFAGTKFDILQHTMLGPIYGVLYIFYYVNLVLPMFCCSVVALMVNNNMYTCLV